MNWWVIHGYLLLRRTFGLWGIIGIRRRADGQFYLSLQSDILAVRLCEAWVKKLISCL